MDAALVKLLRTAVEQTSEDDGWANLGTVGSYISNNSSFSSLNYGYRKFSDLIREIDLFEVRHVKDMGLLIRDKRETREKPVS